MQIVKIPQERVQALLGTSGETKDYLKHRMSVTLTVESEGEVVISGESVDEFIAKDIVKAIGRGFDPAVALRLLSDSYGFKIIDLRDFESSPKAIHRIMGRVIGEKGRTKEIIKEEVEADVACYGHTVSVISKLETLDYALTAIFKLIEGSPHANVYAYLEKCRRKIKEEEIGKLLK
ncbi:TPA: RNA-processing protein [Candidatus Micrarchaeota archaeon]|nr:RNA-processing protein [Candidatus Micrarchaeota archaeon]HIH31029.1 RNA-processing protein [Candidatus Micrarchaeota archaeon]